MVRKSGEGVKTGKPTYLLWLFKCKKRGGAGKTQAEASCESDAPAQAEISIGERGNISGFASKVASRDA